jgi:SpoIIAA-like
MEGVVRVDAVTHDGSHEKGSGRSYERVAVVSDEDWIRPALRALSFLLPGKARGFRVRDLAEAKAWLAQDGA